jgi:hypothetical protein
VASRDFPKTSPIATGQQTQPSNSTQAITLELLRQVRDNGGSIVGMDLLVNNEGVWMTAKVHKCDIDFKKVRGVEMPHFLVSSPSMPACSCHREIAVRWERRSFLWTRFIARAIDRVVVPDESWHSHG